MGGEQVSQSLSPARACRDALGALLLSFFTNCTPVLRIEFEPHAGHAVGKMRGSGGVDSGKRYCMAYLRELHLIRLSTQVEGIPVAGTSHDRSRV